MITFIHVADPSCGRLPSNPLNDATLVVSSAGVLAHPLVLQSQYGSIAIVDFRILGIGMVRESAQSLAKDLSPWTLFGIVSMLLSGALMFATDPDMYYLNHPFLGER